MCLDCLPELPQELIDLIIDELQTDVHTLRASALAGHIFLHRARTHLFRQLVLAPPLPASSLRKCRPPFSSPPLSVLRYVRKLRLIGLGNRGKEQWDPTELHSILDALTNLQELSIVNVDALVLKLVQSALSSKPLDTLFLNVLRFEDRDGFYSLIRSFSRLKHFSLHQFQCDSPSSPPSSLITPNKLDTLELAYHSYGSDVAEMLVDLRSLRGLKTLLVRPASTDDLESIGNIIDATRDSLERLDVGAMRMISRPDGLPYLNLRHLQSLSLSISDSPVHQPLLRWWTDTLRVSDEAYQLEELVINVGVHFYDADVEESDVTSHFFAESYQWEELDKMLTRSQMRELRKVVVRIQLREGGEGAMMMMRELEDVIQKGLSRLGRQRLLEVELTDCLHRPGIRQT
ncbi:hypothetical protein IW261DRAFT_329470 [Armillaria novae-zelandiae]|uniref:F-box domain-containing protein n=1 Tax=Armillaria novae-zelandiae TaxID=153914 RepID=A0AA39P3P9_9AGAR|nr:hypothetical protein IW261DRAFT_329470 [Armillaria novae-zelandiae]